MEERREYRWMLGDDKQIAEIDSYEKLSSQHLVEECMIAANKCAAIFLSEAGAPGPFVVHQGFRQDRSEEAKTFWRSTAPNSKTRPSTRLQAIARYWLISAKPLTSNRCETWSTGSCRGPC